MGQDHVTRTLVREVVENKVAHAYLFAGPRGTGKTTTARLLAKALNCTNRGTDGEPCTKCISCEGIGSSMSIDVIELDAASHNKVEDIREIRVNVGTVAAAGGAKRVYILDEAHMLSRAAGNALLKTLEEPPEHVIFVLATTEPYKLLDTIRSRSQRFDFHPIPTDTVITYLQDISEKEGFTPEPEGLAMIASHAEGSMRDALSLLEQVAALGGGKVEAASVARALGLADQEAFGLLAKAIVDQDAPAALGLVARLAAQGADLRRFVAEAIGFFRGVFLAQYAPNLEEVADEPQDTLAEWRRHAETLPAADVLRAVDQLSEALLHLRQGREERLVVELMLLRLTRPETSFDPASLGARLQKIEDRVRDLGKGAPLPAARDQEDDERPKGEALPLRETSDAPKTDVSERSEAATPDPVAQGPAESSAPFEQRDESQAETPPDGALTSQVPAPIVGLDLGTFESVWPALVARVRDETGPRRHALLKEAEPISVKGATVTLTVPGHLPFHLEQLRQDEDLMQAVTSIAAELLGGAISIEYAQGDDGGRAAVSAPEPPPRAPDKTELAEGAAHETDPTDMVVDLLGGEVVSE